MLHPKPCMTGKVLRQLHHENRKPVSTSVSQHSTCPGIRVTSTVGHEPGKAYVQWNNVEPFTYNTQQNKRSSCNNLLIRDTRYLCKPASQIHCFAICFQAFVDRKQMIHFSWRDQDNTSLIVAVTVPLTIILILLVTLVFYKP
uniref:Uncharacterized protein n=1 Tax=Glossina palpalis gambiensis TaxID=67801 RepID=A0A1B0C3S7_9MUSC